MKFGERVEKPRPWRKSWRILIGLLFVGNISSASIWQEGWVDTELVDEPTYSGKCENRNFGSWSYPGSAPWGCDAHNYGESYRAEAIYAPFTLNLAKLHLDTEMDAEGPAQAQYDERRAHLSKYMTNMYHLIKTLAEKYYKGRKPRVSSKELEVWTDSVLALVAQESNYSHYRIVDDDQPLKIIMGDHNKSIGALQIYMEAHSVSSPDHYFDLSKNILFGIEQFYNHWEKAGRGQASCLPVRSLKDQARAAYSAYNGGGGAICRWNTASEKWHQANQGCTFDTKTDYEDRCSRHSRLKFLLHDLHYEKKLRKAPWKRYADTGSDYELPIDVDCLLRGNDLCAISPEKRTSFLAGNILTYFDPGESNQGEYCTIGRDGKLHCLTGDHDVACLNKFGKINQYHKIYRLSAPDVDFDRISHKNRHQICADSIEGLFKVGALIKTKRSIAIRRNTSRSSEAIGSTKRGVFQVVDFYIRPGKAQDRYYLVAAKTKLGTEFGYIYAGSTKTSTKSQYADWDQWATLAKPEEIDNWSGSEKVIPRAGDRYQVVATHPQPLWRSIDSTKPRPKVKGYFGFGDEFEVLDVELRGTSSFNKVYLKIRGKNGSEGYMYAGQAAPHYSLPMYVRPIGEDEGVSQ